MTELTTVGELVRALDGMPDSTLEVDVGYDAGTAHFGDRLSVTLGADGKVWIRPAGEDTE